MPRFGKILGLQRLETAAIPILKADVVALDAQSCERGSAIVQSDPGSGAPMVQALFLPLQSPLEQVSILSKVMKGTRQMHIMLPGKTLAEAAG
jgi:hypothetical protein